MTLAALPRTDLLPAPLWLITGLHLLTLTLHFVAMNLLVGGLAVVLLGRLEDRWRHPIVQRLLRLFPALVAATVTLGVAPLLFLQLTHGAEVYAASIVSAWWWLAVPLAVIVAYASLYAGAFAKPTHPRLGTWTVLALIGLAYVSMVYTSVFSLAERPDLQASLYATSQAGIVLHARIDEWIFRWLHMLTGALMVGAFFVAGLGKGDEAAARAGRTFALYGFALAAVTGIVYLLSLGDHLRPFMRSDGIYFVAAGIVLSLAALHLLFKRRLVLASALVVASLGTMVAARHVLRLVVLPPERHPALRYADKVVPQWGVFVVFLVCFVAALVLVAWMLHLFFRTREGDGARVG